MMEERHPLHAGETEARLRGILCSLAILTFLFTPAELILLEHTGDWVQLIPFAASFLGLVAAGWILVEPTRGRIQGAKWISVAIALSGVVGAVKHVLHNLELELEIRPGSTWLDALPEALHGAAPTLATGILILGALLILGATYRHPAAGPGSPS